jgi:hypothetical protein
MALCCANEGERIARHNALRDALYSTAAVASLGPTKEVRFLLPGSRGSNSKNRSPLHMLAEFSDTSLVQEVFFSYLQDLRSTEFFAPSYETWVEMSPGNCILCLAGG